MHMARSTYYFEISRNDVVAERNQEILEEIKRVFVENKCRYGVRRVHRELINRGYQVNHKRVQRLMHKAGLAGKRPKEKYYSYKGEIGKIADNIIARDFSTTAPLQKWATDVSQFNFSWGKCYISPVLDMNTNEIIDCNKQIDNDESTVSDLPALKERLRFYREAGLEEKLPILRKMSTEEAAFNQVKKEIELFSPIKWPSLSTLKDDSKELLVLQQLVTEFNSQSEKIQTDYNALISWLSLEYAAIRGKWNKQSESYDEAIRDSLCTIEGIQDKSATDIAKDFSETIMKIKNAEPIQDRIDRQKEVKIRLLMKRKTLIESCKKSLDDYMECINKQVKKLNKNVFSNSIRISIEYRQVKDAVIAQLKTIKGVGDVSLTGFLQYSDFDIFTFADDIRKGKDILIEKYKFTGGIAEKIISHYDELSLLRMEEMQLDDIYHIELFVNGQFKPLERLSKGQQCTAILNILLVENKDPLIVDQPEDNLDNAFIADSLIASIRKNKLLRHYIFATHNANIPVFGDAELIVAMEEQDGKGRIIQGGIGSIDTPSVRDYAVQVLEGGREAFLMREKKYGIGEYNHFMNK